MGRDLDRFAAAFLDSFNAQIAMFPAMMQPGVQEFIEAWKPKAKAWRMLGGGGGGHLAVVVGVTPGGVIPIKSRRKGLM